jgi:hypothetical protein
VKRISTFKETDREGAESLLCYNAHGLQQARLASNHQFALPELWIE